MILKHIRHHLVHTRLAKRILSEPVDLEIFRQKPSFKFVVGIIIVGFSYVIGWPLISVLGILAVYFKEPLLLGGMPVVYGLSHLVFWLGMLIAGKDTVVYMNTFLKWSLYRGLKKLAGDEFDYQPDDPK